MSRVREPLMELPSVAIRIAAMILGACGTVEVLVLADTGRGLPPLALVAFAVGISGGALAASVLFERVLRFRAAIQEASSYVVAGVLTGIVARAGFMMRPGTSIFTVSSAHAGGSGVVFLFAFVAFVVALALEIAKRVAMNNSLVPQDVEGDDSDGRVNTRIKISRLWIVLAFALLGLQGILAQFVPAGTNPEQRYNVAMDGLSRVVGWITLVAMPACLVAERILRRHHDRVRILGALAVIAAIILWIEARLTMRAISGM